MEFSNWMLMELDKEDRGKAQELIAPLGVIKLVGMVVGGVCVLLGILLCVVYSEQMKVFLWYYLLISACGGVVGLFIALIAQVHINKMYLQIRLMREMQKIAAHNNGDNQ